MQLGDPQTGELMRTRLLRNIALVLLGITLLLTAGFVLWAETPLGPLESALPALQSDAFVRVVQEEWIVFQPLTHSPQIGLILYPGGRVDPTAYAPLARGIAQGDVLVVIVPMPLNLAVLGFNRALDVQAAFPEIKHWAVGGHSLGGAMAAHFVSEHPAAVEGLVLMGAYSAEGDDLSSTSLSVLSIYGSQDGLTTPEDVAAGRSRLPEDTLYFEIEGGNHAQFGSYGSQPGDLPASIPREEQQEQIIEATLAFLQQLDSD
jgi:hypothetical protein